MGKEYRIIDTGASLTIGLVTFDPFGEPATVDYVLPETRDLNDMKSIVDSIVVALKKPVISAENLS